MALNFDYNEPLDENNYAYKQLDITPSIFAHILVSLYDGKQVKRKQAIDDVLAYHEEKGGYRGTQPGTTLFKKATQTLGEHAQNIGYGIWRFKQQLAEEIEEYENISIGKENVSVEETNKYSVDRTIGEGNETVYVYYYDVYKVKAALSSSSKWECKVGRTDGSIFVRVFAQSTTAYPEYPHIALEIRTNQSRELEQALHSILKLRQQWISNAPGTEWFFTSPVEIEYIYNYIMNNTEDKGQEE